MKRFFLSLLVMVLFAAAGNACTNFIVGKRASADGSFRTVPTAMA